MENKLTSDGFTKKYFQFEIKDPHIRRVFNDCNKVVSERLRLPGNQISLFEKFSLYETKVKKLQKIQQDSKSILAESAIREVIEKNFYAYFNKAQEELSEFKDDLVYDLSKIISEMSILPTDRITEEHKKITEEHIKIFALVISMLEEAIINDSFTLLNREQMMRILDLIRMIEPLKNPFLKEKRI